MVKRKYRGHTSAVQPTSKQTETFLKKRPVGDSSDTPSEPLDNRNAFRRRWVKVFAGLIFDGFFLLALMVFVFAGAPLAPFHGDEGMHIYSSIDHDILKRDGVLSLVTEPPYAIDSDAHFRLAAGSVYRHALGFVRYLAGVGPEHLPPRPGWLWVASFEQNVAAGFFPKLELIALGRTTSSLFLALAALPAFWLGWLIWRRPGAWLLSGLLIMQPAVLLNGRRAMQEGCLLFFGLLTLAVAGWLAKEMQAGKKPRLLGWLGLAMAGGLALASKLSGLCFLVPSLVLVSVAMGRFGRIKDFAPHLAAPVLAGMGAFIIYLALSPGLWNKPWERLRDQAAIRTELIGYLNDGAGAGFWKQAARLVGMPLLTSPQYFEVAEWADTPGLADAVQAYETSPFYGLGGAAFWGWGVVSLAAFGGWQAVYKKDRFGISLLVGLILCAAMLFPNPLPWERYYLPLLPFWLSLAVFGLSVRFR